MITRYAAALVLLLAAGPVRAEDPAGAIAEVIDRQMQAFRDGDPAGAFEFASPTIRGLFGTADNFGRMVANGYPPIWQPGAVRYLDLREENGRLQQRVEVLDAEGRAHYFDYEMVETGSGWRINGVRPVAPPGVLS